jgi:hypothetical protein
MTRDRKQNLREDKYQGKDMFSFAKESASLSDPQIEILREKSRCSSECTVRLFSNKF